MGSSPNRFLCFFFAQEPAEKADILVSELLGSWGDNELSPECLDGAQRFLKEGGVSIPQEYTSYVAPMSSHKVCVGATRMLFVFVFGLVR